MVLGMRYGSSFNYAVAGLYRTAVAVSALIIPLSASVVYAADPPAPRGNVSVNVNPTTSYYTATNSTLRLPNGVSAAPTSGALPVVTKYSGGLQQTIPMGVTIDAIKKSAPLPAVVRSTTQSVKGAATRCLKSGRCNVALLVAGEGLNRLFDGLDWVMGEGGKVQVSSEPASFQAPPLSDSDLLLVQSSLSRCYNATNLRADRWDSGIRASCVNPLPVIKTTNSNGSITGTVCEASSGGYGLMGYSGGLCRYGTGTLFNPRIERPLNDGEIDAGVENNYTPEPSDWPALTPEMQPDDIEITSAPTLQGEPITTTVYDAEGNPHKVTKTNIWYDFDIRDNPSPRPALDMKTREETETYENGELTGTTTTESTASGGSGSSPAPPPESPIDCDLFPTACAWFDWTQEEPTEPDDDLSSLLQEVPIVSETYTITGGVAACPAPMVLDLSVFGSREVSYQPLCDLASTMKYLYLALMSFAAAVLLNRSVNRV